MSKYTPQINTADRLIRAKGAAVYITRPTESGFDPITQAATQAPAVTTFRGVLFPPGKSAERHIGSLINRNLTEVYLAQKGQSVTPVPGDNLNVGGTLANGVVTGGTDWRLIWTYTLDPAADGAIFTHAFAER